MFHNRLITYLCILFGFVRVFAQNADEYKAPQCLLPGGNPCDEGVEGVGNPDNYDIVWQKDGSVIVNTEVTFISGIKRYPGLELSNPIYEDEMLLLAPEDFQPPSSTEVVLSDDGSSFITKINDDFDDPKWLAFTNSLGIVTKDLTANGVTKLEVFRRDKFDSNDSDNVPDSNFMFYLDDSEESLADILYGCTTENNINNFQRQQVSFDAYGYKKYPWSSVSYLPSTDFVRNWNKPHNASWANATEKAIIVAAIVVASAVIVIYALPELGLVGSSGLFADSAEAEAQIITYGRTIYGTAQTMSGAEYFYSGLGAITRRSTMMITLASLTSVSAANAYYNDNGNTLSSFNENEIKLKSKNTVYLPNNTSVFDDSTPESQIKKLESYFSNFKIECPTNAPNGIKCFESGYEPVVVKVKAKETHIHSMAIPGSVRDIVTPYQLFKSKKWFYNSSDELQDQFLETNGTDVSLKDVSEVFINDSSLNKGVLQRTLFEGSGDVELYIPNESNTQDNSFYVYSHGEPSFSNEKIVTFDLGKAGNHDVTGLAMHLYKCLVLNDDDNSTTITLSSSGLNPLYLTGDNIIIKKYEESGLLFVGTDTQNLFTSTALKYEDSDGNAVTTGKPQTHAVVSNAVSILDDDFIERDAETLATDKFGLYVGAVGEAESGILTNNAALLKVTIPDFVFEDQYNLSSLLELETFVKANKHLPYVPNQQDYKADGYYSAGQMMMGQLQNLEELYLHTFSQQEQIIALDKDTKALDKDLKHLEQLINQLKKQ